MLEIANFLQYRINHRFISRSILVMPKEGVIHGYENIFELSESGRLDERGGYEICPVCYWEDDGQDDHDADHVRGGPNGPVSLTAARRNFALFGACDERSQHFVRTPRAEDRQLR